MRDVTPLLMPRPRFGCLHKPTAAAWFLRGSAAELAGDLANARRAYQRAVDAQPLHREANTNLGRLVHAAGDAAAAEGFFRVALLGDRAQAASWFNLGVALHDQARTAEAITAYRTALSFEPSLAAAHYNLALMLDGCADLGSRREALRHLAAYRRLAR